MLRSLTKKRVVVALSVVAALVVTGAAVAFFTTSGTGTGHASIGSATNWTVSPGVATGSMFPGSGTSTITYTIDNTSDQAQHLTSTSAIVANDGATPDANILDHNTPVVGCLAKWFTPVNTSPGDQDVAAHGSSTSGSVAVSMSDPGVSQNACQNHTPDITISAN
jgi:hypothetical protein